MTQEKTTRDLRQEECFKKWVAAKCKGTLIAATGLQKPCYREIYNIITAQYRQKAFMENTEITLNLTV